MKTYEQVLEKVELALSKGEYHFCIKFLSPIIESYPISSKEGINLRTILITALCGINKKEDAKELCKELLKSYDYKTREDAKYLMEVINSPEIKKPENWNINLESNISISNNSLNSPNSKRNNKEEERFINITDTPTGEIKTFQKGFTFIILLILLILIPLLSGCVKIENTLDLSEIESINNYLKIESKYINKFPWQIAFEEKIQDVFPDAETKIETYDFALNNKNLSLEKTEAILKKILQTAGDLAGSSTDLKINTTEKNFIFSKKFLYMIEFDLTTLSEEQGLEINFRIINPSKATLIGQNNPQVEISKNLIVWNLIPGQVNSLNFSFWKQNKLLIWVSLISILIMFAYLLRFYRFKIGTDFPQLPS